MASKYQQQSSVKSSRKITFFVPGAGIDREVISTDICRYLGNDATVKPGQHTDVESGATIPGYFVTAYRALTTEQLADLKADSLRWAAERQRNPPRGQSSGEGYRQSVTRQQGWSEPPPPARDPNYPPPTGYTGVAQPRPGGLAQPPYPPEWNRPDQYQSQEGYQLGPNLEVNTYSQSAPRNQPAPYQDMRQLPGGYHPPRPQQYYNQAGQVISPPGYMTQRETPPAQGQSQDPSGRDPSREESMDYEYDDDYQESPRERERDPIIQRPAYREPEAAKDRHRDGRHGRR